MGADTADFGRWLRVLVEWVSDTRVKAAKQREQQAKAGK